MAHEGVGSRVRRGALASLLLIFALAACGGCSSDTSPGTEPICNKVVDDAADVVPTASAEAVPTASGGTILPGTYELSAVTVYVGAGASTDLPAQTLSQVFVITKDVIEQASKVNDVESHATTSFSVSGATLSTKDTCPAPRSEDLEFTATDTDLRLYAVRSRGTFEQVYTLRAN
ncbi:MAG TPA: hypothetical protein VF395_21270 [Polyangiaceae bacterium]